MNATNQTTQPKSTFKSAYHLFCTTLKNGLLSFSLLPNSSASDYLSRAKVQRNANEQLKNDWINVGNQLQHAINTSASSQKKKK